MTKEREALKLAVARLEWFVDAYPHDITVSKEDFLRPFKEALAQQKQKPVAWEGGEGWESLAWELCADENGEEACNELIWEGGPIPEPWGDRWMKYEGEAKRLIALVQKHTTPPQRTWVDLTDEEMNQIWLEQNKTHGSVIWRFSRALEAKLKEKNT